MTAARQLPDDARCRGCDYPLRGLDSSACPECGRRFDRDDTGSFRSAVNPSWWTSRLLKPYNRRDRKYPVIATALLIWGLRVPGWADCFIWLGITVWAAILLPMFLKQLGHAVMTRRSAGLCPITDSDRRHVRLTGRCLVLSMILCAIPVPMYLCFYVSQPFFEHVRRRVYAQPFQSKPQEGVWIGLYYISKIDRCPHGLQFDIDTFNNRYPGEAFIYKDDPGRCMNHSPTDKPFGGDWYTAE